jgi:DNA-binding CsgD family transcriptional regulator
LYLSRHTIDFHLRQIFNKLGIRSRVELARIVAEQRIECRIDPEDAA